MNDWERRTLRIYSRLTKRNRTRPWEKGCGGGEFIPKAGGNSCHRWRDNCGSSHGQRWQVWAAAACVAFSIGSGGGAYPLATGVTPDWCWGNIPVQTCGGEFI